MGAKFLAQNLTVSYGLKIKALDNLSLELNKDQIHVILGQNGSGKSTLMRILAGVQPLQQGEVKLDGIDRGFDAKNYNSNLIYLAEDYPLPGYLSIDEFAQIYQSLYPKFNRSVFARILEIGEIQNKKRTGQLSRGQQTLAQFALAIAANVEVLLIDEVTAVLDPYVRRHVIEELVSHQRETQNMVILSTNIATEFYGENLNVLILKDGKLALQGPFLELQSQFCKIEEKHLDDLAKQKMARIYRGADNVFYIGRSSDLINSPNQKLASQMSKATLDEIFVFFSDRKIK